MLRTCLLNLSAIGVTAWSLTACANTAASRDSPQVEVVQVDIHAPPLLEVAPPVVIGRNDVDSLTMFGSVRDIEIGHNGNIYVLDGMANPGVRVFTPSGLPIRQFGREGRGPLELSNARALGLRHDSLFVLDDRLEVFDTAGNPRTSQTLTHDSFTSYYSMAVLPAGLVLFQRSFGRPVNERRADTVAAYLLADDTVAKAAPLVRFGVNVFAPTGLPFSRVEWLGAEPQLSFSESGTSFHTVGDTFHIRMLAAEGSSKDFVGRVPRVATTDADFDAAIIAAERSARSLGMGVNAGDFRRAGIPRARHRPVIRRLVVNEKNDLLVFRMDLTRGVYDEEQAGGEGEWILLSTASNAAKRLQFPISFVPFSFRGNTIAGTIRRIDGGVAVAVFRL